MRMRKWQEIYDAVVTAKDAEATLADLLPAGSDSIQLLTAITSGSKVEVWRQLAVIFATAHMEQEGLIDLYKIDITDIAAKSRYGTDRWYYDMTLKFQLGHILVEENGAIKYNTIDPVAQVVKFCAIGRAAGKVIIKAAKGEASNPQQLSTEELTGLQDYWNEIAPFMINVQVISSPADLFKADMTIFYDAKIGKSVIQPLVEAAINSYLTGLDFRGNFKTNELIDRLQAITGVVDVWVGLLEGKDSLSSSFLQINRLYPARAGYMRVDPVSPLATTLKYTDSNE